MYNINEILKSFINEEEKSFHRFNSWNNCYSFFQNKYFKYNSDDDYDDRAALHLGFYLASWGMYRGSTFLLQNDYKIHIGIVKILKNYYYKDIYNFKNIMQIKQEIINHYHIYAHTNSKNNNLASDTLITKILMGTFCNVPAYDRFLLRGIEKYNKVSSINYINKEFNEASFIALNEFYQAHQNEFIIYEKKYPKMKLLDMFFWKLGYEN
ncbi:hypothetical protein [Aliarcobacter cryaerophilus]|uniref:hypothetical protein n=1 Tax=Aliarcobacter cryaerophilus TaxID=28198 RepID=UPI00112F55F7|nr:hypothetical protein [Aliarcobacter cryaerophilus]